MYTAGPPAEWSLAQFKGKAGHLHNAGRNKPTAYRTNKGAFPGGKLIRHGKESTLLKGSQPEKPAEDPIK